MISPLPSPCKVRTAYTVPNFSNPTGRLVPLQDRKALVDAAQTTGTWLIEDDPYGTLYYDSLPLPRMLTIAATGALLPNGPVIYPAPSPKNSPPASVLAGSSPPLK